MSYLYRTEAKGIQSWILASDRLREIAGGSEIVASIDDFARERAASCGGTVDYAAAGVAELRFPAREQLAEFASLWPLAVSERAPGLHVVQAWVQGDGIDARRELQSRLAEARVLQPPDLPEAGPLLARAGRTGLPAVAGSAEGSRDRAVSAKERAFREGRDSLTRLLLPPPDSGEFLQDIDRFPPGYVAVVHADANGIGRLLASGKVKDVKKFSDALGEATLNAARAAVGTLRRDSGSGHLAARPIVLGGDDFTMIAHASEVLGFTRTFLRVFETETAEHTGDLGDRLFACAGVAIVKPGWPFHKAHDLAGELCQAAKRAYRDASCSGLAFHRVTTALSSSWDELVERTLATDGRVGNVPRDPKPELDRPKDQRAVLTANPYTLEQLDQLERLAEAAVALPRGVLRQWATLARSSTRRAQDHWQRMREVVGDRDPEALRDFDGALYDLGVDRETGWNVERGSTPLLDVLEWHQARRQPKRERGHRRKEVRRAS